MVDCEVLAVVSNGFSTLSLVSWIFAQLPQIVTNYRNKSADGISPSFLLLWFMGDFLSFTSCLLNDIVLAFQLYLSMFFLCNDVMLCFQYYYYNSVYPKRHASIYEPVPTASDDTPISVSSAFPHDTSAVNIRHHTSTDSNAAFSNASTSPSGGYSSTSTSPTGLKQALVTATLAAGTQALPLVYARGTSSGSVAESSGEERLGLFLAWCCTVVYMSSRCPQLWKNYKRKSVEGINSILFGAALIGNLTYTISILTSCEFVNGDSKSEFFIRELPYILGSSGTVIFDVAYFYQRYIYRNSGRETLQMNLQSWDTDHRQSSESSSLM